MASSHRIAGFLAVAGIALLPSCQKGQEEAGFSGAGKGPAYGRGSLSPAGGEHIPPGKADHRSTRGPSAAGLLSKIRSFDISEGYTSEYASWVKDLIKEDPKGALSALYTPDTIAAQIGFSELCEELVRTDPEALLAWLKTDLRQLTSDDQLVSRYFADALRSIAKVDPGQAIALLDSSGMSSSQKQNSVLAIFYSISQSDPEQALKTASGLPDALQGRAYEAISRGLATKDPDKAIEVAGLIPRAQDRASALCHVFNDLIRDNPEAAIAKVQAMEPSQFEKIGVASLTNGTRFLESLAKLKPEALQSLMNGIIPSGGNKALFDRSVVALASRDINSSLAIVTNLPDSAFKSELTETAFLIATRSSDGAESLLKMQGLTGQDRLRAIEGIATATVQKNFDEVLKLSGSLEGADQSRFLATALKTTKPEDFEQVLAKVSSGELRKNLGSDDYNEVIKEVGVRLAVTNSEKALEWCDTLPQDLRSNAVRGVATEMANQDIGRLANWLSAKEHNDEWAIGASILIKHLDYTDPESAQQWKDALSASSKKP